MPACQGNPAGACDSLQLHAQATTHFTNTQKESNVLCAMHIQGTSGRFVRVSAVVALQVRQQITSIQHSHMGRHRQHYITISHF
jgi:hypothetical protein